MGFVQEFDIQDENYLLDLAYKLSFSEDSKAFVENIKNFHIQNPDDRFQIAKNMITAHANQEHARYISNFDLKRPEHAVELAKMLAAKMDFQGFTIAYYLDQFTIKTEEDSIKLSEKDLIAIAEILAQFDIDSWDKNYCKRACLAYTIKYFSIDDEEALFRIGMKLVKKQGMKIRAFLKNFGISHIETLPGGEILRWFYEKLQKDLPWGPTIFDLKDAFEKRKLAEEFGSVFRYMDSLNKNTENKQEVKACIVWLAYILDMAAIDPVRFDCIKKHIRGSENLWLSIVMHPDPPIRHAMTDLAFQTLADPGSYEKYLKFINADKRLHLIGLFISVTEAGWLADFEKRFKESYKNQFKDGSILKSLLQLMKTLLVDYKYAGACDLFEEIFPVCLDAKAKKIMDKSNVKKKILVIQGIINLAGDHYEVALQNVDRGDTYLNLFREVIPLKPVENFHAQFSKYFDSDLQPFLLRYASGLKLIGPVYSHRALALLAGFVDSVLDESFRMKRCAHSWHLATIFRVRPELKEEWMKIEERPLLKQGPVVVKLPCSKKFVEDKVGNNHLDPNEFPNIKKFIDASEVDKTEIHHFLFEQIRIFERNGNPIKLPDELGNDQNEYRYEYPKYKLELAIINFYYSGEQNLDPSKKRKSNADIENYKLDHLKKVKTSLDFLLSKGIRGGAVNEFLNDVETTLKLLETNPKVHKNLTISISDNYRDLLMCGTDVQGSCQSINGNPDVNKCLLAYLMDGKNRLIAIKDASGKITARAIIRLLIDKENEPVLMLEGIYPSAVPEEHLKELYRFAAEQAKRLRLSLFAEGGNTDEILRSLSGCFYEYVDALRGPVADGIFRIDRTRLLYRAED